MSENALILIDFQNDYFEGGAFPLVETDIAAARAAKLVDRFRKAGRPVIHVRHHSTESDATFFVPGTEGAEINGLVAPAAGEPVVTKSNINAFLDTDLKALLDTRGIGHVTVVGAMSHMCVDAFVRAASDFGYGVTVAHDAVATRDLDFGGRTVPAAEVHAAFMSALAFAYAEVASTEDLLQR
ncbi:cysteine hydrolase family protein [Rhizobium sp. C4]|uniref:cysteine hydrolase family protein n=1 Tax=Rhizobium sp. C4 TaxID=1349800 RepID=UPI001E3ACA1D|nr:cysteine hydrolase family protein [Rhizobium sp. C4]MCD2174355.1 cysteine hydrolase [Rhizobium sp. C4]